MKLLKELRDEEKDRPGSLDAPRLFLAMFPVGARNGKFIDPWLGVFVLTGEPGRFNVSDFPDVKALWT